MAIELKTEALIINVFHGVPGVPRRKMERFARKFYTVVSIWNLQALFANLLVHSKSFLSMGGVTSAGVLCGKRKFAGNAG